MAKFRTKSQGTKTVNLAGGEAFKESPKLELVSLLLTSFVGNKFYESAGGQLDRLTNLVSAISDKKFVAKAAIFARTEYGMRSITHALLAELTKVVKGEPWTKEAIAKAIYRPDDALEVLAYYGQKYGKPFPNSLKKGLALGLQKFNAYQLAKYRGEGSSVKMVDLLNLVHLKPNKDNAETFEKLMKGTLKSTDTFESKLTKAGQDAAKFDDSEKEEKLAELKGAAWADLIKEKKIGYFALLRNLRNIEKDAPEVLDEALVMLKDEKLIKKSLVMPFRFNTARHEVTNRKTVEALSDAIEIAMVNVPKFDGKTLIALDCSGSMSGKPMEIGSLFAAVLYKANPDAAFMSFGSDAQYKVFNSKDSVLSIAKQMQRSAGGTNFHAIFEQANQPYDRIIILSDLQGWMGYDAPTGSLAIYEKRMAVKSFIYSFDLNGYGTLQFPQDRVFAITGFSEKVFDLFKALETDRNALISKIEAIEL